MRCAPDAPWCEGQEVGEAIQSDVSNLFFAAQAVCLRAQARLASANHAGAIADAHLALELGRGAHASSGRQPPLAEMPHVVLAESSCALRLFDAALANLTIAATRVPPHGAAAARIDALRTAVRKSKDAWDHDELRRAGFAGFRSHFGHGGAASSREGAHAKSNPRHSSRRPHAAFAGGWAAGAQRWQYSDWSKARWDEVSLRKGLARREGRREGCCVRVGRVAA